jgi:hypothetical protein
VYACATASMSEVEAADAPPNSRGAMHPKPCNFLLHGDPQAQRTHLALRPQGSGAPRGRRRRSQVP